jgi:hypothetical protein
MSSFSTDTTTRPSKFINQHILIIINNKIKLKSLIIKNLNVMYKK